MKYNIDQNQFKNFTRKTITIPLVGSLILSGVFIYIIFHLMGVSEWVSHTNKVTGEAYQLFQITTDAANGARGYLITGDESFLDPYQRGINQTEEKFKALEDITADNPAQSNIIKEIHRIFNSWNTDYADKVIELRRNNKNFEKILPSTIGKNKMDEVRANFTRFINVEDALLVKRTANTKSAINLALTIILGTCALAGIFLAFFTKKQLTLLSDNYSSVIDKQVEQNLALEAQEWIQTGRTGLMEKIRGDHTLEHLSANILNYLCHRLDGKVAAIYNMENSILKRTGSFALSRENDKGTLYFKNGEGLVGQAAMENRLVHLKNVPDNYMSLTSGIGSTKPRELVLLPLVTDNTVKGVLEIAFLEGVSDRVMEYLKLCSESIAIAFQSAEYRTTLNNLLEESQRQTEELQAQQEELQANNEELEEQTNALKESQIRLETQQSELEQTNEQLSKQSLELEIQSEAVSLKNDELKKAQEGLEVKARELELSSQYKSQFMANMSHELRTPLNSTLILSQLLLEDKRNRLGTEEKEFAQTILSSSNDLLNLINDILDLSKVEAGKIELAPEEMELKGFLQTMERLFKPMAETKNIQFITKVDAGIPSSIFIDRQRLEQILKNLISNALKFTEKGHVTVQISRAGAENSKRINFSVIDSGIGIPPEQQKIIFDAFKQADGTTSRRYGGTGLGLTISKDLARLLGGDIIVQSEAGKGSTFTLNLPEKHGEAGLVTTAKNDLSEKKSFDLPIVKKEIAPRNQPPYLYTPLPFSDDKGKLNRELRILLVIEDDSNFAKILYDLSHELKFNCIITQSAEEGIKAAEEFLPQAIILDMHLPDRSGLTVIDQLKANAKTRHIPIHIVSAQDQSTMALKMGAIGYLKKPVALGDIREAITKMEETFTRSMKRVLVVEDNKVQRESIKELIQDKSVEVSMAENATVAIEFLTKHTFDCMILDLNLPGMTGYQLLEKMATTEMVSHPPVIVYTGRDISKAEEQKLQKYSQAIILKGAHSPERLLSEVTLFLHQVETELSKDRQSILQKLRDREKIFESKKILLVDDDVRNIFALSSALEGKGAVIETARNGKEAVLKVQKDPSIDLVLMDIMMPEMDGYEATKIIRQDPRFNNLPIIAVTAKAMADDQEKCREAGANDYLAKPVDLQKLLSLLRVWMPQGGR